jgi:hypothetical protein
MLNDSSSNRPPNALRDSSPLPPPISVCSVSVTVVVVEPLPTSALNPGAFHDSICVIELGQFESIQAIF